MFKLNKMTDYAVLVLRAMNEASVSGALQTATDIAKQARVPEPTVSKLLKLLTKAEIIRSIRGAHGGYVLKKEMSQINMIDLIESIDGPIAVVACMEGHHGVSCTIEHQCPMRGNWNELNNRIVDVLKNFTLDLVIKPMNEKSKVRKIS